ncbi:hypothetical protein SK128_014270, partial [Halocaridina rubra]
MILLKEKYSDDVLENQLRCQHNAFLFCCDNQYRSNYRNDSAVAKDGDNEVDFVKEKSIN